MNAKEYEKILSLLANTIDEGIHVVNAEGITVFYSAGMATLEKIRAEDVLGKPFREVFSAIPEEESTLLKALKGEGTVNKKQTYLNKYGKEITTINTTLPVKNGNQVVAALEISKDVTHLQKMSNTILDLQSETLKIKSAEKPAIKRYHFDDLVGESSEFRNVINIVKKASKSSASVFIYGETGTGKELVAQSIHFASDRKDRPFLAQNCAAIPGELLESMLFGTAKGGFTGALDREGLFEQASGGTLLLDEISAMPYDLQSKLLRVLQEEYIRRVGGTKDIPIDVRIIATANEPAKTLIEEGKLRRDLYYRLNIVNVTLPPLRHRKEDIPLLVDTFCKKYNEKFDKNIIGITEGVRRKLMSHDYPGNVRELENALMAAISMSDASTLLLEEDQINFSMMGNAYYLPEGLDGTDLPNQSESLPEYLESIE